VDYSKKTPEQLIIVIGERDTKIEGLLAQLKDKDAVIVSLENARTEDALTLKGLQDVLKTNNETIVGLQGQLVEAGTLITDLKGQLTQANDTLESASDQVIVKHSNVSYRAKVKQFSHEGTIYNATDLKKNPALVKQLIEDELGVLEQVKPKA
jgi:hypothetical protein